MIVWLATGNAHKQRELAAILSAGGVSGGVTIPADAGLEFDPEESGDTFYDNALLKARALYRLLQKRRPALYKNGDPVIADDSGLCVDALDGRPGIYSARYAGKAGASDGKKLAQAEQYKLLLEELGDTPLRSARFVCAMALLYDENRFYLAQETFEGEIVKGPAFARGNGGFGYDPVLYIPSLGRTAAELSEEEKNRSSHRGKAGSIIAKLLGT